MLSVCSRQEDNFNVDFFRCNFCQDISFVLVMLYTPKDAQNNKDLVSVHYENKYIILFEAAIQSWRSWLLFFGKKCKIWGYF